MASRLFIYFCHNTLDKVDIFLSGTDKDETQVRTIETQQLHQLPNCENTTVIIPHLWANTLQTDLPALTPSKLRAAIPYALEERIADDITDVHFAFDKNFKDDLGFCSIIIRKQKLEAILQRLKEQAINAKEILTDAYALVPFDHQMNIVKLDDYTLLRRNQAFATAYDNSVYEQYAKDIEAETARDEVDIDSPSVSKQSYSQFLLDFANHYGQQKYLNLLQGDYQPKLNTDKAFVFWKVNSVLAILIVIAFISAQGAFFYSLNKKYKALKLQNLNLYQSFFPNSSSVLSPRFRIQKLMQDTGTENTRNPLFPIMYKLAPLIAAHNKVQLQSISYRDQKLNIKLITTKFSDLEELQLAMKAKGLKVKQTGANSDGKQISASFEVIL